MSRKSPYTNEAINLTYPSCAGSEKIPQREFTVPAIW